MGASRCIHSRRRGKTWRSSSIASPAAGPEGLNQRPLACEAVVWILAGGCQARATTVRGRSQGFAASRLASGPLLFGPGTGCERGTPLGRIRKLRAHDAAVSPLPTLLVWAPVEDQATCAG